MSKMWKVYIQTDRLATDNMWSEKLILAFSYTKGENLHCFRIQKLKLMKLYACSHGSFQQRFSLPFSSFSAHAPSFSDFELMVWITFMGGLGIGSFWVMFVGGVVSDVKVLFSSSSSSSSPESWQNHGINVIQIYDEYQQIL